ncbi:MAG: ribbon-helix-helix protein, CopG family [Planctomycetota bacterium]|nr:ribbon-helix-helix protein, CopG family [Planctomycetota bacterium]
MPTGIPIKDSVAIMLKVPPEMAKAIDDARRAAEDLPSRPELIRRILAEKLGVKT